MIYHFTSDSFHFISPFFGSLCQSLFGAREEVRGTLRGVVLPALVGRWAHAGAGRIGSATTVAKVHFSSLLQGLGFFELLSLNSID